VCCFGTKPLVTKPQPTEKQRRLCPVCGAEMERAAFPRVGGILPGLVPGVTVKMKCPNCKYIRG